MTKSTKAAKYSIAMVAAIQAAFEVDGFLNAAKCAEILKDEAFAGSDITQRGVIAKVRSMRLEYRKAEKVSKTGEAVATKETIVSQIEAALGVTGLDSLAKAEKTALRILLSVVSATDEDAESADSDESVAA